MKVRRVLISRWDVHISFGALVAVIMVMPAFLASWTGWPHLFNTSVLGTLWPALLLGASALVVGSVLPDVDGKGKIRWVSGPLLGSMVLLIFLTSYVRSGDLLSIPGFLLGEGALYFTLFTAAGYLLLLLPLKHRGVMHSPRAGIAYGVLFGAFTGIISGLPLALMFISGLFASLGYLWHLALDGRMF